MRVPASSLREISMTRLPTRPGALKKILNFSGAHCCSSLWIEIGLQDVARGKTSMRTWAYMPSTHVLCLNTAGAWSLWTVHQTSSHDGGVGLFVAQVDGLIDGQQSEAVIGEGKGHNAEQFKPCRCMATRDITLTAIRCPNSPLEPLQVVRTMIRRAYSFLKKES